MASEPKPTGVVGRRVAENLRRLRKGTSTYELARLLTAIGWPIRANGITRIESGTRRVDVDDLVALALVLGVSPNRLLFPAMLQVPGRHYDVPVVGDAVAPDSDIWQWATGEKPMALTGDDQPDGAAVAAFTVENRPHYFSSPTSGADVVDAVATALRQAVARGVPVGLVRQVLNDAIDDIDEPGTGGVALDAATAGGSGTVGD